MEACDELRLNSGQSLILPRMQSNSLVTSPGGFHLLAADFSLDDPLSLTGTQLGLAWTVHPDYDPKKHDESLKHAWNVLRYQARMNREIGEVEVGPGEKGDWPAFPAITLKFSITKLEIIASEQLAVSHLSSCNCYTETGRTGSVERVGSQADPGSNVVVVVLTGSTWLFRLSSIGATSKKERAKRPRLSSLLAVLLDSLSCFPSCRLSLQGFHPAQTRKPRPYQSRPTDRMTLPSRRRMDQVTTNYLPQGPRPTGRQSRAPSLMQLRHPR